MQIFFFSTKEFEGLLMRSEVVRLLLKCVLFSNLYIGLWQSLDEALCEGLIRTWKMVFGKLTVFPRQAQKKLPFNLSCLYVCECPELRMKSYSNRGLQAL